jgi:hypothetical protein
MKRILLLALVLPACATAAPGPVQTGGSDAAGAIANVVLASGVGAARVAEGDCFTICGPGTECNPKTKLCDVIPCRGLCGSNEVCDQSGPLDHCVKAPGLSISQKHDSNADQALPVGIAPPLSSAPPSAPGHPDVPAAGP